METHKLFLTISVLSCVCHGWEVQVPESVQAVEGSCVMVSCQTNPHERVNWYKYKRSGYPVVYSTDTAAILPEFKGRTSVPGSPSQGNCTLQINSVRKADNEIYVYAYIYPDTTSTPYKYIKINVVNPEIHISVDSTHTEGNLSSASCTVRHSCPSSPPPIEWVGLASESNKVNTMMVSGGLWTSVAHAKFRVNRQDSGKILSCKSNFNDNWIQSSTVSFNVLHAPTDVKIAGADGAVVEGASVSLTCTSTSNPEPTGYEWLVIHKNSPVKPSTSKTFDLRDVKRDTSVSCTAVNSVGRGQSAKVLLNVRFPPTILVSSTCSASARGVRCMCQAEAEPSAKISWTVNGSSAILKLFNTTTKSSGRTTVSELTGPAASSVSCEASNALGSKTYQMPIQRSLSEAPPTILENSTCAGSPGRIRCVCRAEAEPEANILWTVDGSSALLPLFNTTTQYVGRITESELIGPPASNVSCKASNILGIDSYQMPIEHTLTEGNFFPGFIPAVVAVVAVVVCIILGIIVVAVCLKKRRQLPADSTLRSHTVDHESSGKSDSQLKTDNLNLNVNIYTKKEAEEDIYANTMDDPQISEDDRCDIYENY